MFKAFDNYMHNNFSKYTRLNMYASLATLYSFMICDLRERLGDNSYLFEMRMKDEGITYEEVIEKHFKEVSVARLSGFFVVIALIIATVILASKGMVVLSIITAIMPLVMLLISIVLLKREVKEFKEQGVNLQSYG